MIMVKDLSQLFNEVLIVPLDESLAGSLEALYNVVVNDDEFIIDNCIVYFITGRGNPIKGILQRHYEDKNGKALSLPEICYQLYAQYVVYRYVCHDKEPLLASKINAALVVQSMMTVHRGSKTQMASMPYVDEIKYFVKCFVNNAQTELQDVEQLRILGQAAFTQEQKNDPDLFYKVKALAIKAAKYDFSLFRTQLNAISDDRPYMKAFEVAAKLSNVNHWEYVMAEPDVIIADLLDGYTNNKMLLSIKRDLEQSNGYNAYCPEKSSSVILNFLYCEKNEGGLAQQKFTPTQLAQHLFYEFLSDKD